MVRTLGDIAQPVRVISTSARVCNAISKFLDDEACRAFVVAQDGKPTGILSRAAAMEVSASAGHNAINAMLVGDIAATRPQYVDADTSIAKFALRQRATETGFEAPGFLVVRAGKLLGIAFKEDILPALAHENALRAKSIRALKEKARTAPPIKKAETKDADIEMLSTLAHEIRTPLTGMMGLAEMLASRKIDADSRNIAKTIVQSGRNLDRIVTDTLDYGRLGAGKLDVHSEPSDLSDFVTELRNLWTTQARRRGLSLMIDLSPDVPRLIKVDIGKVRQITNNLVSNALKFTERGGVSVSVAVQSPGGEMMMSVEVSDTGAGIAPRDKGRLFKAFETGVQPGERVPGWGLGLSISNGLAKHLGGNLSVADNPSGGSVFTLMVPVEKITPLASKEDRPLRSGAFSLGDALLVEDHEPSAFIVSEALNTAGWNVVRARSLEAARELCEARAFQVILCDLHLIDGHAGPFVEDIRSGWGLNHDKPILAITAEISGMLEAVCRAQGFDRVVRKPVQGPELIAGIADIVMSRAADEPVNATRAILRGRLAS